MPANSGVITLRQKLDHETKAFYNITIAARDLGSPTLAGYAYFLVTVSDVDDNAPVFYKNEYSASIFENATGGAFVSQVNASDMDAAEEHKTIYYRIEEGNDERLFVIGELNGTVYLNWTGASLDREKVAVYPLTVAAISRVNGTEQKSTVVVSIRIVNSFRNVCNSRATKIVPPSPKLVLSWFALKNVIENSRKISYSIAKVQQRKAMCLYLNYFQETVKNKMRRYFPSGLCFSRTRKDP